MAKQPCNEVEVAPGGNRDRSAHPEEGDHGRLLELRDAIHAFGESHGHTPGPPRTIAGMLEVEMFRLRLRQKEMAEELGIGASRLSEVLRGKRPAGIDLRRASYTKLHIPAEEVLPLD